MTYFAETETLEESVVQTVRLSDLFTPTARQRDAFKALATASFLLYGGAGGGGKSAFLRWALVTLLLKWAAEGLVGVHVALFSRDYPTLADRQVGKIAREFPDWLGKLTDTKTDGLGFYLRPEYGGGILKLRNLDDPSKYKSAEFAAIGVEELTENELDTFNDLRWRLRWHGIPQPKFIAATNPEGVGLYWVKQYWILREFPPELQPRAHEFVFVPAKLDDNPHVDPNYRRELESLPPHRRAALLEGSWDVFAGQMFSDGGGILKLRNLDDPSKYKSAEFAAIGVEELTENELDTFNDLRWRLRWQGIPQPKFIAATNPEGVGLYWVKQYWILREFPPELQPRAHEFVFVPAKLDDNPHVDPNYRRELESLPPHRRAALLEGSWDVFAGQMFSEFRREIHVVDPFPIPAWWSRWGSNDPGYQDPGTWYRFAADQEGNVFITDEWVFEQVYYSEQAKKVAADIGNVGVPSFWVTGMDAFVREKGEHRGKTIVDYYEMAGLGGFRAPVHGKGCRANMAATFHEYLRPFDVPADPQDPAKGTRKAAKLRIFSTCKYLIKTLPTLPVDENDREAVVECGHDHGYQGAGYGLQAFHTRRSTEPVDRAPKPGTYAHVLRHDEVLRKDDEPSGSLLSRGIRW